MMYFGRRVWRGEAEGAFSEINAFSLEEADNSDMRSSIIICSVQTDLNDFSRNVRLLKRNIKQQDSYLQCGHSWILLFDRFYVKSFEIVQF